jgi:16S rRNA (cytosine967-C5)-methyltransferase
MKPTKSLRLIALDVLVDVLEHKKSLKIALEKARKITASDSWSWIQDVTSGTLRWKGRLEMLLDSTCLHKKPSGWLRKILLIACYQILLQDRVHPGCVVSETIDEVKKKCGLSASRFANACLRKVATEDIQNLPFPEKQPQKLQALWASLPLWLWNQLCEDLGQKQACNYAEASLHRPPFWIHTQKDPHDRNAVPGPFPHAWKLPSLGSIAKKPGFEEGEFIVQDISSQIIVHEVSELLLGKIHKVLDLCASPGGKAVHLAWKGLQVSASDFSKKRIPLLENTILRTRAPIQIIQWNDLKTLQPQDLVWVDAPCSAVGTLRKQPDIRWSKNAGDLTSLNKIQKEALWEGWKKVKPQGFLVYSVCSVLNQEGADLIQSASLPAKILKTWTLGPHQAPHGDGFWAILLQKND